MSYPGDIEYRLNFSEGVDTRSVSTKVLRTCSFPITYFIASALLSRSQMVDLKGRDPQYSLMTYLVEQLTLTSPDLLDWTSSLTLVPKVAGYSVKAIGAEVDGQ